MKPFQSYIFEINKPYEFRVKMATVNPSTVMDKIKNALEAYQLESVSAVKSLPVQEHREFPQWGGPCECWQFDVKVAYPTTSAYIRQTIKERAHLNPDWICVKTLNEDEYNNEFEMHGKDHDGSLLEQPELKADAGGQELAAQARVGSLLKELESRKYEFAAEGEKSGVMSADEVDTSSPVGTHPRHGRQAVPRPGPGWRRDRRREEGEGTLSAPSWGGRPGP